jgi:hypothetical protein
VKMLFSQQSLLGSVAKDADPMGVLAVEVVAPRQSQCKCDTSEDGETRGAAR